MSCKTINIDLTNVPPVPIQIGVAGENSFRTITFDASKWGADYPDATYTVVYRRSDGYLYPVLVNASADAIVWNPTGTDTAVSGNGQLEVRLLDGETIGKTIIMQTYVAPSLSGDESEPSTPAPDWVNDVADDADRAEAAVEHYPQIRDGYWWVWDVQTETWVNTGVKATGEGGGTAADAVLYTPQTLTPAQQEQARGNIGAASLSDIPSLAAYRTASAQDTIDAAQDVEIAAKYTKPSGGIPASDLAPGVQTSLGKADTALQTAPVTSVNGMTGAVTIPSNVFVAVRGTTTEEEIRAAHSAGKVVICVYQNRVYYLSEGGGTIMLRTAPDTQGKVYALVVTESSWLGITYNLALKSDIPTVPITGVSVNGTELAPQNGVVDVAVPTDYVNTFDFEDRTDPSQVVLSYSSNVIAIEQSGTPLDSLIAAFLNSCNVWFLLPTAYITGIPSSTDMMRFWMTGANLDTSAPTVSLTSEYGGKVYHAVLSPVSEYRMEGQLQVLDYQTAQQVQAAIAAAAELPAGGSTGDFLRKTANGAAWQTVPSAESNSFGGA